MYNDLYQLPAVGLTLNLVKAIASNLHKNQIRVAGQLDVMVSAWICLVATMKYGVTIAVLTSTAIHGGEAAVNK